MKRVPPPPTTKKTGKSVSKPPKLTPPPSQILFTSQDQQIQQPTNLQINEANQPVDTTPIISNNEPETLINQVQITPQQHNQTLSKNPINQDNALIAQSQNQHYEQIELKVNFQSQKVPTIKKLPTRQPPGLKRTVAPPKVGLKRTSPSPQQTSMIILQEPVEPPITTAEPQNSIIQVQVPQAQQKPPKYQQKVVTNQPQQIKSQIMSNLQTQQLQNNNEETQKTTKNQPALQNIQEIAQVLPEQQRKPIPPPAAKKFGGPKIPPPTKKLFNPPKPITPIISSVPTQQNFQSNPKTNQLTNQQSLPVQQELHPDELPSKKQDLTQKPSPKRQVSQNQDQIANVNKKTAPLPPVKKITVPSPKKLETKPPVKQPIVQTLKNEEKPASQINQAKESPKIQINQDPPQQKNKENQPFQQLPQDSSNAYNQLEQKLRRLEIMRSRIDQSSEQSYSNYNEEIEEEQQEIEDSVQQQDANQKRDFINIKDEHDINVGQKQLQREEFVIGETNYDQMEIKDDHEQQIIPSNQGTSNISNPFLDQSQTQPLHSNPQSNELTELSSSQNEEDSLMPIPTNNLVNSSFPVEQTQQKYMPEEASNSPLESHGSMVRNRPIQNQIKRSEINQEKQRGFDKAPQVKEDSSKGKRDYQATTTLKRSSQKEKPQQNQPSCDPTNAQQPPCNHITSIQSLLQQFNCRKSQYLANLEKLKRVEEKFKKEETSYQERIGALLQELNHKNLLLLNQTNLTVDRMPNHDRLKEVEEL